MRERGEGGGSFRLSEIKRAWLISQALFMVGLCHLLPQGLDLPV